MLRVDLTRRGALASIAATLAARPAAAAAPSLFAPSGPYVLPDGRVRIVGTDIMRAMIEALNRRFAEMHPGFAPEMELEKGLMAVGPVAFGTTPFAPMPRLFTPIELAAFRAVAGCDPIVIRAAHGSVVAQDRTAVLAIYAHRDNPIAQLTLEQVASVFSTGQPGGDIRTWGQLGLDGEWAERPIHPVGTPEDTGFGSYMVHERMNGRALTPAATIRSISTEVMAIVGGDVGALGYCAINFASAHTKQVRVGATASGPFLLGTAGEVMADEYALDRFVYFYVRPQADGRLEPWVQAYLELVLSPEGQRLVAGEPNSFLPLGDAALARERRILAERSRG